jgi:formyltetrahydrofolate deformylase
VDDSRYTARLLISCADRPGIVAGIAGFLHSRGANITDSHQHSSDPEGGRFFMRLEFVLEGMDATAFERDFAAEVGGPLGLHWRITHAARPQRVAVLVSREDHCLMDLLWRWRRGELPGEIVLVASNHPDHTAVVEDFGLPYHHVPVERDRKPEAEAQLLELLAGRCDVVVLARYMQILSGDFLERVGVPVINIHHSFLPAFAGANPYQRAFERGVKIIGATAHYATEELDAGPIIEQDVRHVSHRESPETMMRTGRDIERTVLARAVNAHLEDRVLVHGNRTVVF